MNDLRRVSYRKRSDDPRDDLILSKPVFKVLVKNIPSHIREENIKTLFEPYGSVVSVIIPPTKNHQFARFCIVQMRNEDDAERAILHLNGKQYLNEILSISSYQSSKK